MLKQRKVIAIFLMTCMMLMVFVSCNTTKNASVDTSAPERQLDLTVWNTQGTDYVPKEIKNNIVEKWLVDKTRVKIKNIYGNDGGQWDPKLTKLAAGGNLPDIVYCQSGQGPAHFAKLDKLGKAWELTPKMIQKYAPELWKKTPEYLWDRIKVNGKILGIPFNFLPTKKVLPDLNDEELNLVQKLKINPNNDVMANPGGYLYIRDDLLKKFYPNAKSYDELAALLAQKREPIGEELLDIPINTTEEYIKFMYDLKNAKLKENDKTVFAFGYSGGDNWEALSWLGADMYGYKGHNYTSTWNEVKKCIEVPLVGSMVKQAAKTQNQMINDKVIDPESLMHTKAQFESKVLNGQYAICAVGMLGDTVAINKQLKDAGKPYRYRPFITQVPAHEEYKMFSEERLWGDSICILKTLTENELCQVLKWINVQYTDEYAQIQNWGPKEAGLYKETADGKREFTDERFKKYYLDKDASALKPEETKGLQGPLTAGYRVGGLFGVFPTYVSKWTPEILLNYEKYTPACGSGFKFLPSSPHIKNVKTYPPCQAWSSVFADIPEVVSFWGERDQWEQQFKMAIASPNGSFDSNWNKAITNLNMIANIATMEKKMTAIAKPIAEQIKANND